MRSSTTSAARSEVGAGTFDYLVNNAGISLHKPFDQTTEAEFDQIMNVHFKGVYFRLRSCCRWMNDGVTGLVNICPDYASALPVRQPMERQRARSKY